MPKNELYPVGIVVDDDDDDGLPLLTTREIELPDGDGKVRFHLRPNGRIFLLELVTRNGVVELDPNQADVSEYERLLVSSNSR